MNAGYKGLRDMPYTSPKYYKKMSTRFKDRSGEFSGANIYIPEDVVFEDATGNGTPDDPLIVNWNTSLSAITDGAIVGYNTSETLRAVFSGVGSGQREQVYRFFYHDTVTMSPYEMTVPTRDAAIQPPVNTDIYDLAVAPWAVVKTDFEALAVSPVGNAVVLDKVVLEGKNS